MPEAFVAAGSNLRPRTHLRQGLALLAGRWPDLRVSRAFVSPAAGLDAPDFINLVVAFDTLLPVGQLKEALRGIEAACGRRRDAEHRALVSLDLDLLLYGDCCGKYDGVVLPAPELLEHAYLLGPLSDLASGLRHPAVGQTIGELWARAGTAGAELVPISLEGDD